MNRNKKYKVKLFTKQKKAFWYILLPLPPALIALFFLLLENIAKNFTLKLNFSNGLYIILITSTLIIALISWYLSPLTRSKIQSTKHILKRIIEENNFYYMNDEKIISSMIIKFQFEQNNLILEVYSNGGKYSNKINDLTPQFQTAFNMTVISVQDDYANHTKYILSDTKNNYIDSTSDWNM